MAVDTQRAGVVLRAMVDMFATGDVTSVTSFVAPDYLDHQGLGGVEIVGADGFCSVVLAARRDYVSLDVVVEDLIADGGRAAARLSWSGTRATGAAMRRETIEIVRVVGGLAVEHWGTRLG